jgi:hypothetical protein
MPQAENRGRFQPGRPGGPGRLRRAPDRSRADLSQLIMTAAVETGFIRPTLAMPASPGRRPCNHALQPSLGHTSPCTQLRPWSRLPPARVVPQDRREGGLRRSLLTRQHDHRILVPLQALAKLVRSLSPLRLQTHPITAAIAAVLGSPKSRARISSTL